MPVQVHKPTGQQSIEMSSADQQYVQWINDRLTMYGQLPYTVPQRMIVSCIIQSARLFYRMYYNAQESLWMILREEDVKKFSDENFPVLKRQGYTGYGVKLHPSIRAIRQIRETDNNNNLSAMEILDNLQYGVNPQYYGQALIGINNNLYITEAVCKMVEATAMENITGVSIPYNYNPLTNMLLISYDIRKAIAIHVSRDIPLANLYKDDLFDRHVLASCKRELKRLIGSHTIQLPGDVTVNVDEVCNNIEDAQTVEEILKAASGVGDIILFGRD
mgnify:FL=1